MKYLYRTFAVLFLFIISLQMVAVSAEETRRYKTAEERRDAGISHQLTDWLQLMPLLEFETSRSRFMPVDSASTTEREREKSLQLEFTLESEDVSWVNAEVAYEYDDVKRRMILDEALVEFEYEDYKLEIGRLTVPFGEQFSRFVTSPMLEFGETQARAMVFAYEPDDEFELSVFVLKSKLNLDLMDDDKYDWGLALVNQLDDNWSMGASYLSDLSESDEQLLEEQAFYEKRVGAFSAYLAYELDEVDVSLEYVSALTDFNEFEADSNRPSAWNLELGYFPGGAIEYMWRIEGSNELEEMPALKTGLGVTWHISANIYSTFEALYGRYKSNYVEDDDENLLDNLSQLAAQLTIAF